MIKPEENKETKKEEIKECVGSLETKIGTLEEKRIAKRKLEEEIALMETEFSCRQMREVKVEDFDSLTPEEKFSTYAYYKISDRVNGTVYEYHGMQVEQMFGLEKEIRQNFKAGVYGKSLDYKGKYITFLYYLKRVK